MNRLLLVTVLALGIAASAAAQSISPRIPTDAEVRALTATATPSVLLGSMPQPMKKTAEVVGVYYHDTQIQPFIWRVPTNYTSFQSLWVGQRFTLPAAEGVLDSILVFIRELPIGEIRFVAMKDILRQKVTTDTAKYHFADYFTLPQGSGVVDTARVSAFDIDSTKYTKVDFNAKSVGQEFHIIMQPTAAGGISNMFGTFTDSYDAKPADINPTDDRSHMVITTGTSAYVLFMDQIFRNPTDTSRRLMPNFYMVAFGRIGTVSGMEQVAVASGVELDQNYPNPVASAAPFTTIAFETEKTGYATLDVFDAVGRKIATLHDGMLAAGKHSKVFITNSLAPGMYNYRLNLDGRQAMRRMIVVK